MTIAVPSTPNANLSFRGILTNSGSIAVTGTNIIYADSSGAAINNQASGTFDFQSPASLNINGYTGPTFTNAGILKRSTGSGTATISFPVADSGTIEGDSGTLLLTGGGSGGPGVVNAGAGGTVILGGNFTGSLTGAGAGAVQLSNFTGSGANGVSLSFTGSVLQWASTQNGTNLAGNVTNLGAMSIVVPSTPNANLNLAGTLTNSGHIIVTGANVIYNEANNTTINNLATGTFDFQGTAYLYSNGFTSTSFVNAGLLERSTGTGTATISFPVIDSGTIEGDSGTLLLTGGGGGGSVSSPGNVNAGTGGNVILGGSFSGAFAGSGAGAVQLSNFTGNDATLNFSGSVLQWANTQNGNILAGTVANKGAMTIAVPTSTNSNLSLKGTLTNSGSIIVTGTNVVYADTSSAAIVNQAGATFDFQGPANLYNGSGSGTFTNAGLLSMSAGGATSTINYAVSDTGLILADAGTLDLIGGGSGGSSGNPGEINASNGATVVLSGSYTGSFAGLGSGSVQLSDFIGGGSGATLDFTGNTLQWAHNSLGGIDHQPWHAFDRWKRRLGIDWHAEQ